MANANRNNWSAREKQILRMHLKDSSTQKEAFERASKQLGRSFASCASHYHGYMKNKKVKAVSSNKRSISLGTTFKFNIRSVRVKNNQLIITL